MGIVLLLVPILSFSQPVTIVSPVTNQTYQLPDPASMQTAGEVQGGITSAETVGKALNADAITEKTASASEENDFTKAQTMKNDYIAGMNNFNKNDVTPYKLDLDNYTASGTKFNTLLTKHNKAVQANNALAAKDRKASTVAALNKEKTQIDTWIDQLSKWKDKLDAAKAKLDATNAALQKQQKKYETAEQSSSAKLKASKLKLKGLADQLTLCSNYAGKCRALLTSKFNVNTITDTGYFSSPAYKSAVADLNIYLEKLKNY